MPSSVLRLSGLTAGMVERLHHGLGRLIWRGLIAAIITLAVYVAGMGALLQLLPAHKDRLVSELSNLLDKNIYVGAISGQITGFTPEISLQDVAVVLPGDAEVTVGVSGAVLTIDPWASLLSLEPRLDSLLIRGSQLRLSATNMLGEEASTDFAALTDLLRVFRRVTLEDAQLALEKKAGKADVFSLELELRREGSERRLKGRLSDESTTLMVVEGAGIGDVFDPTNFSGELHGTLRTTDLSRLTGALLQTSVSGAADIDFWYGVRNRQPSLTARVSMTDFSIGDVLLETLTFDAVSRPTDQGWMSTAVGVQVGAGANSAQIDKLQLESRGSSLRLITTEVDVAEASDVLLGSGLLGDSAQEIVSKLAPAGTVIAAELQVDDVRAPQSGWSATAQVTDATTQPINNVPGLYGIDASVEANDRGATAWIVTEGFGLDLPRVYGDVLGFNRVLGTLSAHWASDALFLHDGVIFAEAENHRANIEFGIDIPLFESGDTTPPLAMYLSAGFEQAPIALGRRYVPSVISPDIHGWVDQALVAGTIDAGAFIWRGDFANFGAGSQSMQVGLELEDTTLRFQPEWPELSETMANVWVDTDQVTIKGESAVISGLALTDVSVEITSGADESMVRVVGGATGQASDGFELLRASPIYEFAKPVLDDLTVAGSLVGEIDLAIGLSNSAKDPELALNLTVAEGKVTSERLQLVASNVAGDLSFRSAKGFSSKELNAEVFGRSLDIHLGSGSSGLPDGEVVDAKVTFAVPSGAGAEWISRLLDLDQREDFDSSQFPLTGAATVDVAVAVGAETQVAITSDLAGLAIDLPIPLGKTRDAYAPLDIRFKVGDHPWDIFWYRRLQSRIHRANDEFIGATLDLTPRWRPQALVDSNSQRGLYLSGRLPWIEIEPWLTVFDRLPIQTATTTGSSSVTINEMDFQTVVFGGVNVGPISVDLTPFESWDMLGVNADWLDAELTLHHDEQPSALIINELNLDLVPDLLVRPDPVIRSESEPGGAEVEPEAEEAVLTVPGAPEPPELTAPLQVIIANLSYQDRALGAASFVVNSRDGLLEAREIRGNLADIEILEGSRLFWRRTSASDELAAPYMTTLVLRGNIDNLGDTFKALSVEPVVETRSGALVAELSWPGGPEAINLLALSGSVDVRLKEGSFLPVPSGATGFVRILSMLNLAGLFERANVTRLFEPGVAFKKASGVMNFQPGKIEIPDFKVEGPGGGFQFDSDVDLLTQQIDGELVVTLPLVDNIPWVAALAGGLPVAAGAYLVSKVFKDQVKSLSSGVYSVSGDLAQPEVKFVRVFDASSNKVREVEDQEDPAPQASGGAGVNDEASADATEPSL